MNLKAIMNSVKRVRHKLIELIISRGSGRECPICGWTGYTFLPFGLPGMRRFDAKCPNCGSLERHRLAHLIAKELFNQRRFITLHIAPENCLSKWLRSISTKYISIDLHRSAMHKMDLRNLNFVDESFSLIWCSHVLEHIVEDNKAINEIYRVCQKGGFALIQVPVWRQLTYENTEINEDEDRIKEYYQNDHVRLYGLDLVKHFENVGFSTRILRAQDFGSKVVIRFSLSNIATNEVFIFTK